MHGVPLWCAACGAVCGVRLRPGLLAFFLGSTPLPQRPIPPTLLLSSFPSLPLPVHLCPSSPHSLSVSSIPLSLCQSPPLFLLPFATPARCACLPVCLPVCLPICLSHTRTHTHTRARTHTHAGWGRGWTRSSCVCRGLASCSSPRTSIALSKMRWSARSCYTRPLPFIHSLRQTHPPSCLLLLVVLHKLVLVMLMMVVSWFACSLPLSVSPSLSLFLSLSPSLLHTWVCACARACVRVSSVPTSQGVGGRQAAPAWVCDPLPSREEREK